MRYGGREFFRVTGYKYNHLCLETKEAFWISGPRKDGEDGLYGYRPVPIDDDVRVAYWTELRRMPQRRADPVT